MSLKQSMTGKKNIAGKLITLIQLAVSVICIVLIWNSGLAPTKYLVPLIIVLLILFVITHALQYLKNNISRYLGHQPSDDDHSGSRKRCTSENR